MPDEPISPGDMAPEGVPGTGEDICPDCGGIGELHGQECPSCLGTGKLIVGLGGG